MSPKSLLRLAKNRVKPHIKALRSYFLKKIYSFDKQDLASALIKVGVVPGAVLMVHSSWDRFDEFSGSLTDVIQVLEDAVAPEGTLLMPTLPFEGSAINFANEGKTFDVKRTPSRMGLLTEVFRRSPNVVRSIHPTHSVAAWGRQSLELIEDHYHSSTPCGLGSPWLRLKDCNAKILLMGTTINTMTFYHSVEEILEAKLPLSVFTTESYVMRSKDGNGNLLETTTRLFNRDASCRRDLKPLAEELKRSGNWKTVEVGRLSLVLLEATVVCATLTRMAEAGIYCYKS